MSEINDTFGLVGVSLDGKYEVASIVAEGGFGIVYRATHVALQKVVALKVLKVPPEFSGPTRVAFLEKFTLEARLIAALDHPAIVRVLDFGASPMPVGESAPWMVLDWLDGQTLEAQLAAENGKGSTPAQVYELLSPVFAAIAMANDEGIVHRDLKPANLMLQQSKRGETSIKVLDFGIAKVLDEEERTGSNSGNTRTSSALVAFSLHYAAPEQLTGMRTGVWTDVHALALIVVELLTGRAPYVGTNSGELYVSALSSTRPTPRALGVEVGSWEPVLEQALAFKSSERHASVREFSAALRDALPGACWQPAAAAIARTQVSLVPPAPAITGVEQTVVSTLRGTEVPALQPAPRSRLPVGLILGSVAVIAVIAAALALRPASAPARAAAPPVIASIPPTPTAIAAPPVIAAPTVIAVPTVIAAPVAQAPVVAATPPVVQPRAHGWRRGHRGAAANSQPDTLPIE